MIFSLYIYENQIFEIDNSHSFWNEVENAFYIYLNSNYVNNGSKSDDPYYDHYMYGTLGIIHRKCFLYLSEF